MVAYKHRFFDIVKRCEGMKEFVVGATHASPLPNAYKALKQGWPSLHRPKDFVGQHRVN